jgi:3-oxoacyl-[acyl-carrier protein] reductase
MKLLTNTTAFITGGARGIGAAIAEKFAEHGADVGFSYHTSDAAAEHLLERLRGWGGRYRAYRCDVAQSDEVAQTMAAFLADFGAIDILVNNAGIVRDNLLGLLPLDDWNAVLTTNLTAAYLHTQAALQYMLPARSGRIVNIGSVSGARGNAGQANYAASKAGLVGLTKSVAREVGARNIRCNAIAPGVIETDMTAELRERQPELQRQTALRRLGRPEEVADVAVFLASDLSSYVTGQVIDVCGGL